MKNTTSFCVALLTAATLSACSSLSDNNAGAPTLVTVEHTPMPPVDYGVSYFDDDHRSFVILESGYEHVVLPDGRTVAFKPSWGEADLLSIASQLDGQKSEPAQSEKPADVPKPKVKESVIAESSDDEPNLDRPLTRSESAWDKLCRGDIESMTDGDYFIVMTTEMPEIFKDWCNEREAFSQLK